MRPRVSVIMACYNGAKYLEESIDSILEQTLGDFELIIIDDASTDESRDIIQEYARRNRHIRFSFESQNCGPGPARDIAISMANGVWLAILDCDDVAMPNRLEKQVLWAEKHPETDLLGSAYTIIDSCGRPLRGYRCPTHHHRLMTRLERGQAFPAHSSCLYKKETVQSIGGFNSRYIRSQDADLWFRMGEVGRMACLSEPLVKLRKHASNVSNHNGGQTQRLMGMSAIVCHFLRLKGAFDPSQANDEGQWEEFIDWLTTRVEQEGHLARRQELAELRGAYFAGNSRPLGAWRVAKRLLTSTKTPRIIWEKLFGSDLPARLAAEWNKLKPSRDDRE